MKKWYNNKWLIFLLIFAMLISHGFYKYPNQVLASQTGIVTASKLNVRSEPSITSPKVQLNGADVYLNKGETVNILEEEGEFYYVSLKFNGKTVEGYVHIDYVKVNPDSPTPTPTVAPKPTVTPKPTTAPTTKPKPNDVVTVTKKVSLSASVTASTLNVRSGPGTGYSKVAGLAKGNAVTVVSEVISDGTKWYGISFKSAGKTLTGYASSDYIKLSYKKAIKGEIAVDTIKVRAKAGSKAAYLKSKKSGNILALKKGKAVSITEETSVSNVKWLKLSFTVSDVKYSGYVEASQVGFKTTVAQPTATPTPTVKPTPKPSIAPEPTPTDKITPTPTVKPTPSVTPKPSVAPTPTGSPALTPSAVIPSQGLVMMNDLVILNTISEPVLGKVCNTFYLNVFSEIESSINSMYDENYQQVLLMSGQEVVVSQAKTANGIVYYKVDFWNNGKLKTGYAQAQYIYISSTSTGIGPSPTPSVGNDLDFESKLSMEGFPESYKASLRTLHAIYPEWEFKAYHTGLDWNTVIEKENILGKNLLPVSKSLEWKSLEKGAYNWSTDKFIPFDGTTWVTASKEAVAYYMDPRNFLTASGIFQFEVLRYQEYQNITGVENILKGTAMSNSYYSFVDENGATQRYSYAETFIKAAEYSKVSPYHLASRVKQEVLTKDLTLSGSATGTYSGYEGYYNFYNIGANDSAGGGAIAKGLTYAKNGSSSAATNALYLIPWTSPYKSIVGGSYFIGRDYINKGQDTIYLQKFNVTPVSTYWHQYMSNVEAPFAEAKKVLTAYNGITSSPIIFSIPVYLNMPANPVAVPQKMLNPNNRLSSLKVQNKDGTGLNLTPSFSQTEKNYYLVVENNIDYVNISAATVSTKAKFSGGGYIPLNVGTNEVVIPVTAENGEVANYKITILRN